MLLSRSLQWLAPLLLGATACSATCSAPPALKVTKPTVENYTRLGNWFARHHQFDCASNAFSSALKLQPANARLNLLYGQSLFSGGKAEAAVEPLKQAVQLDPKSVEGHLALASVLSQMQNPRDAELQWRFALEADPASTAARNGLEKDLSGEKNSGWIIALLGPNPGVLGPELTVLLARAYSDSGRLEDAANVLRAASRTDPASVPLANALSGVLVMQSRKQEAEDVLETAMKQHPSDPAVQLLYLRLLVMNDDTARARPLAARLLASDQNNWEVQYLNGLLDRRAGDFAAARPLLEHAAALNPNSIEVRQNLATVLAKLGFPAQAKEQFQKAIDLGSQDPQIRFELAGVLRTLGETQAAQEQIRIYQQGTKSQSDLTQAAAKAAFADQRLAAGDTAQAVQLYRDAVALDPGEPTLAYKLAMALDKAGDPVGEKSALEQAVQLNPGMAQAQNQLGYLASRSGDTADAEKRFRLAVTASPGFVKAWINLAATLYLESRISEAKDAARQALQLDPSNSQARSLLNAP